MTDLMQDRVILAKSYGHLDPKFMVFMSQTYGFPLSLQAAKAAKMGLIIDYAMLEFELGCLPGKNRESISNEIKEIRYFYENA